MTKLFSIAKNTFTEILRQPIYSIIIVASLFLFFITGPLTMFSMGDDDNKVLREIGLSTLFLTSLFISIFAASGAVAEEIDNKTVSTVITKPVARPIFVISKFVGVALAVALAHYICTIALLLMIRNGILDSADDVNDRTVLVAVAATAVLSVLLSAFFNYVYDWKFSSTAVVLLSIFATVSIVLLAFIDRDWRFNPAKNGINLTDIYASILLLLGVLSIAAMAVALSVRFNMAVTLGGCMGFFMVGLVSDYAFGRFADQSILAKIAYFIVPNLQVFWVSDAIYEGSPVPAKYILITAVYAVCYIIAILSIAIALFQRRQVT
ncbi:MAG: ABC transporter permease [Sedimentisphaerales bacterium]|nr:ABC transporter permease [Sedimentisphaerales bacterium]